MVKAKGLRIQAVMSFHACGGNVGDYAQVPLPDWVFKVGINSPKFLCNGWCIWCTPYYHRTK